MKKLTPRQKQIYDFIQEFVKTNSRPPVLREIAKHFNLSIPTVYDHVKRIKGKLPLYTKDRLAKSIYNKLLISPIVDRFEREQDSLPENWNTIRTWLLKFTEWLIK